MFPRILIIGQGLAGTALAWHLHQRGVAFLLVDRDEEVTASKIAAGLVTPITGMRLNLSWRYDTLYPEALAFYQGLEKRLGQRFYHDVPNVRLLRDDEAVALWKKRLLQPELQPYLNPVPGPLVDEAVFDNAHGGYQQQHSGWLDAAAFLQASRAYFQSLGAWQQGEVGTADLSLADSAVHWQGQTFTQAIFSTGWEAAQHPWFQWVPFQSARGSVLSVQADTQGETRIISRGYWLLPRADGSLRVGPTYEVPFDHPHVPSPQALAGLEKKLRSLLKVDFTITDSQTAVRPIIESRQALIGRHPARPQIAFMNGLGSKGVLRAPWIARLLTENLLDGTPLELELDIASN